MKKIILDDRRQYLPNLFMFLMSLVVLEVAIVGGIIAKNSSLVSTVIILFAVIMVLMAIIMIAMAGKVWMGDLRNTGIWKVRRKDGLSLETIIGVKTALYSLLLFLSEAIYALVMALNVSLVYKAFPAEREGLDELFTKVFGEGASLSGKNALVILEFLMVAVAAVTLVFLAVTLVFNGFTRNRYAGVLAGVLYVSVGYFLIRISLSLTKGVKDEGMRSLAGAGVLAVLAVICFLSVRMSVKKHQWDVEEV